MEDKIYPVAVIGGGAAGVMSVLRTVLNNDETLFFPGAPKNKKKSRALWVAKIENIPGFHDYKKGIVNPHKETISWIEASNFKDKLHHLKNRGVEEISKSDEGHFVLKDNKGESYRAQYVICCTGIMDVQPMISGSMDPIFPYANSQLVDYCLRCDGHHTKDKKTTVIGSGAGAAWVAIMLHERYAPPSMTVLTHGEQPQFDEETLFLMDEYNIKVKTGEITGVKGDAKEPRLEGFELENGEFCEAEFSFVSLGSIIYNELPKSLNVDIDKRGYIPTDKWGQTNIDGFFVAGDIRAGIKNQVYTAWDSAVDSADNINSKLRNARRPKPS